MTLMQRQVPSLDVTDLWRRMFESDLESGGFLRVEEFRDGDTLVIRSEVPGIDPERDVDLQVEDGVLRITARREERNEQRDDRTYRSEFRYGVFVRSVVLPPGVREEDIKALYEDGILEIRIPTPAQKQEPKRIQIKKKKD